MTIYMTPFSRIGNREALAPSVDSGYSSIGEAVLESGIAPQTVSKRSAIIYTSDTEGIMFSDYVIKAGENG